MLRTALGEYSPATCLICREPGFFWVSVRFLKSAARIIAVKITAAKSIARK